MVGSPAATEPPPPASAAPELDAATAAATAALQATVLATDTRAVAAPATAVVGSELLRPTATHGPTDSSLCEEGEPNSGFTRVLHCECAAPRAELERFKRTVAFAGKFAHAMHQHVGAPVRGVQGVQMRRAAHERADVA